MKYSSVLFLLILFLLLCLEAYHAGAEPVRKNPMIDIPRTIERLKAHLHELTVVIGERSVRLPENLEKTAGYIQSFYKDIGLTALHNEPYDYRG